MSILNFFHSYLPSPVIFSWGPLTFYWYGLLVGLGVAVGYAVTRRLWQAKGFKLAELDGLAFILVPAGLVGARLLDVFLFEWWYFRDHLGAIFSFWQGGLSWHGALLGGGLAVWWWARWRGRSLLLVSDLLAPGLAVGQALGRWGNYFNQEIFGLPTTLPWGIPIAEPLRPEAYVSAVYFHPVFLYESLALAVIALLVWRLYRSLWPAGRLFASYLVLSGLVRLVLEFVRVDEQVLLLGLRSGWWVAAVTVLLGVVIWFWSGYKSVAEVDLPRP